MRFITTVIFMLKAFTCAVLILLINASAFASCPPLINGSFMTINQDGHSSYVDPGLQAFFEDLHIKTHFDLNSPILDIGSGYGGGTYQLLKLGAKNIYANDLSKQNLTCMKRHIEPVSKHYKANIHYLDGDITSASITDQLPNHAFSFIFAKNSIQFLSHAQLIQLMTLLNQKMKNNGIIAILIENPYIKKLDDMVAEIFTAYRKNPNQSINMLVQHNYSVYSFPGNRHCSYLAYSQASSSMRLPGFPCEIPMDNSSNGSAQMLIPEILVFLMKASGFDYIAGNQYPDHENTVLLIFKKSGDLSNRQINKNIKNWINATLTQAEGRH